MSTGTSYQPRKKTAERYGIHVRSIERWEQNPEMNFPKPLVVNGRKYDNLEALEAWERMRASNSLRAPRNSATIDRKDS